MKKRILILSLTTFIYGYTYGMYDAHPIDQATQEKLNQELKIAALKGNYEDFQAFMSKGARISSLDHTLIDALKQNGYYAHKQSSQPNPYYLILRIIKEHVPWLIGKPYCPPGGYARVFHDQVLDSDLYE
jgi:hypothetical protein